MSFFTKSSGSGFTAGQLAQFSNTTGKPPGQWARVSGVLRSPDAHSQYRARIIPFPLGTGWSASDIVNAHRVAADRKLALVYGSGTTRATLIVDIDTGAWVETTSSWAPGYATHSYSNFVASGSKLYLFGSFATGSPYTYNLTTRVLDMSATPPTMSVGPSLGTRARREYAAGKLANGNILIVGGTVGNVTSGTSGLTDIFDPAGQSFTAYDDCPLQTGTGGEVIPLADGRAVVRLPSGTLLFNPAQPSGAQWEALPAVPAGLAFGGMLPTGEAIIGTTTGRAWMLSAEKTWVELNYAYGAPAIFLGAKGVSQTSDGQLLAANNAVGFLALIDTSADVLPNTSVSFYAVKE